MLKQPERSIVFTPNEIIDQIHRELLRHNVDFQLISLEKWNQYILARTIEDILMLDISPGYDRMMEHMASIIRSNYRRYNGDEHITLHEDVGTKLLPFVGSDDLPFESQLDLYRYRVILGPRKVTGQIHHFDRDRDS